MDHHIQTAKEVRRYVLYKGTTIDLSKIKYIEFISSEDLKYSVIRIQYTNGARPFEYSYSTKKQYEALKQAQIDFCGPDIADL